MGGSSFAPLVLLTIIIAIYGWPRSDFYQRFLLSAAVIYVVPLALLSPLARYSMPVIPILMLFSSYALVFFLKLEHKFGGHSRVLQKG